MNRMTTRLLLAASAVTALAAGPTLIAAPAVAAPPAGSQTEGVIAGAWIVTLKDGESPDRVADDHRLNEGAQVEHLYRHALNGYAARMSEAAAARVAQDNRVLSVQADRVVSVPRAAAKPGGGGTGAGEVAPTGVSRSNAVGKAGLPAVTVAVIDTGIDPTHPDLAARINTSLSKNCSTGTSWADGNGHGTHVAGTVAAIRNTEGVVGVAPGVSLAAVRVLDARGSGTWSAVICGIDFVTANAQSIQVANMSLGGSGSEGALCGRSDTQALRQAICNSVAAGVTYVVAAGNSAVDAAGFVPAAYDEVITVSALADFDGRPGGLAAPTCRDDVDDTFANFSNHGLDVDLIAPGVCIRSTWKGGGYNIISGTSMAAPHVAGAAALWVSKQTTRPSPDAVKAALQGAGSLDWNNGDGRDGTKELLLDVNTF